MNNAPELEKKISYLITKDGTTQHTITHTLKKLPRSQNSKQEFSETNRLSLSALLGFGIATTFLILSTIRPNNPLLTAGGTAGYFIFPLLTILATLLGWFNTCPLSDEENEKATQLFEDRRAAMGAGDRMLTLWLTQELHRYLGEIYLGRPLMVLYRERGGEVVLDVEVLRSRYLSSEPGV